jgi:pimeloyl-ACP methyl ester carboxylesterase
MVDPVMDDVTSGGAARAGVTAAGWLEGGRDGYAAVNGVRLHFVEMGEGPLVLLLHGFPECWYTWRHQLPALAAAGYRAVAVDLRGYNLSGRPPGVEAYRLTELVEDVHALGARSAAVVGHDWGGVIAWHLAARHPEVVERLVAVNAPHPRRFAEELRRPAQLRRSWYMGFFQLRWLPEAALRRDDYAALGRVWRRQPVRPGAYSETDVAAMKAAISQPGALTAALNYYRAAARHGRSALRPAPSLVRQRTLVIWGERDAALVPELADGLERWVPDVRVARLPDASHWVAFDAPARLTELLLEFLAG